MTLAIARPATAVENDVMIASIGVSANTPTITAPAGWTLVRQTDNTNTNANSLAVYYRVATANEPTHYTWTLSASTGAVGGIQAFFNVDTASPIDVENGQTTANGTAHATPSVNTTVGNTMLVTSHTFASSRTWTAPGGMTESFDVASIAPNNANGQSLEGARVAQAAAGATGAKSATVGGNGDVGNAHILALRPAMRIALPTGTVQNDVMIASIAVQPNTAAITPPAGWILVNRIDNAAATANSLAVYSKTATAAEPSSYIWGLSGASFFVGGIQTFSGVDTTTPVDVQAGQATPSATTHATPSVVTTVANTMVVTSHTLASSRLWTPPAGMTESFDVAALTTTNAAGQSMEGARVLQAAAGATGAKTANAGGNADAGNAHILALRPSGTSINIARPGTAVENDVMIAAIGITPSSVTITAPDGWTLIRRTNNAGGVSNSLAVYQKVVTAGEPASYYWAFSAAATAVGGIQAFSGVDTANPIDVENGQTTASGTAHATPNVATTVANTMVVTSHTYSSSQNWTAPAGMTESFDQRSAGASATGQSVLGARVAQAAAGATGAKSATAAATADFGNAHILALRPQATNDLDLPTPIGTIAGDIMIASIGFQPSNLTITPPAGWLSIRRTPNAAGTANTLETFWRVAVGGEPAVHQFVFSAVATAAVGGIQAFSGADTSSPINVENGQTTASGTAHATPNVATTVTNTMVVTAHTFASSATWTPPTGMIESVDRANVAAGAAGQAIELNRVNQGPIGATGVKTANAAANADTGNTHILALRSAPVIVTPARFNAYDGAPSGISGFIKTRIAGSNISMAIVAVNAAGTAVEGGFSGDVQVELVDSSSGGAVDANNCVAAWPVITTTPASATVTLTNGLGTLSIMSAANSYPNARIRVIYPAGSTYAAATAKGCSVDNFAIRPNGFTGFSASDNDWQTAGTGRSLNDSTFGSVVHKAGRLFSVRANAVNAAGSPAITSNYTGAPTATLSACGPGVGFEACTSGFGTLTLATSFASGQLISDAASYSDVGTFALQLVDSTFSDVDLADGSTDAERHIVSPVINVGRFVPNHFAVSLNVTPTTPAFGAACAGGFTYVGQTFSYATAPVITVVAKNFADGDTTRYAGNWWRITNTSVTPGTQAARYSWAAGTLDLSGLPLVTADPVIASTGSGTGTFTFGSGTGLRFSRTAPEVFDADISLAINVIDADGVTYASNPARFGMATIGNGIHFTNGKSMRFGRLTIANASGSPLLPLPVRIEAQYWNGKAFITNDADSCTSIDASAASSNVAMGNYTGGLAITLGSPNCKTAISGGGALNKGRRLLQLSIPKVSGGVDLTVNLGAVALGNACLVAGVPPTTPPNAPDTPANLQYLQSGTGFTQNPSARATFGVYTGSDEQIHRQENY